WRRDGGGVNEMVEVVVSVRWFRWGWRGDDDDNDDDEGGVWWRVGGAWGCHGEAATVWLPEGIGGAWPEVSWWIGEIRRWSSFLVLAGKVARKVFR
ncbi:hypothetical protein Tco_0135525, partial [Tanacetum coccineum]